MGLFDRFKPMPPVHHPPPGFVPIRVEFTDEEARAISDYRREMAGVARESEGKDGTLYVTPKVSDALDAIGLSRYVIKLMATAGEPNLAESESSLLLEKACVAQAKVVALHDLPYYRFLWAQVSELAGDFDAADRRFSLSLQRGDEFQPDAADQTAMDYLSGVGHDVAGAPRKARAAIRARIWVEAITAELVTAESILQVLDAERLRLDRDLTAATILAMLAHAAGAGMMIEQADDVDMLLAVLCVRLGIRAVLPREDFNAIWSAVHGLLTEEPPSAENAPSLWAPLVFGLKDAGCEIEHLLDYPWVLYTSMAYLRFMIRARTLAAKHSGSNERGIRLATEFITADTTLFAAEYKTLAQQVLGDQATNAEMRTRIGAVLVEQNLRQIQGIEPLNG